MYRGTGRTWRSVLGPLAGSELAFRTAADVNWARVVAVLGEAAENSVLTGLLAVMAKWSNVFGNIGLALQLLLYFVFVYAFVPALFPDEFGEWTDDLRFRFLTTVLVFVPYLSLTVKILLSDPTTILGLFVITGLAYHVSFEMYQSDPFEPTEGAIFRVLDTVVNAENDQIPNEKNLATRTEGFTINPEADGVRPLIARMLSAIACGCVLGVFTVYLGVLVYVVGLFFPLPELLLIGWSGYGWVAGRVSWIPGSERSGDVEKAVYETVVAAFTVPTKGLATLIFLLFGFFTASLPFLAFVSVLAALSLSEIRGILANLVRGGATFVMLFGLFAFGSYSLWYWWRTSRRVPAFLASMSGENREASVTRPVWLTGPPVALLAIGATTSLAGSLYLHSHPSLNLWPVWLTVASGLAYLPGLALMAVAVIRTFKTEPQTPKTENRKLPIAALVQVVGVTFASFATLNYDAIKQEGLSAYANGLSSMLILVVLGGLSTLLIFYSREIYERAEDADGRRAAVLKAGPAFAQAVLCGGLLLVREETWMAVVAIVLFASGGVYLIHPDK